MATNETYNGWTNRETWALSLHLNNDQGLQEGALDVVRSDQEHHMIGSGEPYTARLAGETVKAYAESLLTVDGYRETFGDDSANLPAQLSRIAEDVGSLYRIDWDEIGASFLDMVNEEL